MSTSTCGYMWTPPCQDFSSAGHQNGLAGKRDVGKLLRCSLAYIKEKGPRLAIFENVPSLLAKRFRPHLALDYVVHAGKLNSADCGVPQARARLFIVTIREDCVAHSASQMYAFCDSRF